MLHFLKKHKRALITTLLVVVFLVNPIGVNFAHAAEDSVCSGWETLASAGLNKIVCFVVKTVLLIPMTLASFFLWLSGTFLNFVINYTIIDLKKNLEDLKGLEVAWGTIRDLINISFIFVLLYTAIGTILGIAKADWKKVVSSVIIAAILINFSIFFTRVLIDASNIVTVAFYNAIIDPATGGGLSDLVMNKLGLSSFYKIGDSSVLSQFSLTKSAVVGIGSAIFIAVAAFSFMAIAIMLVLRYITFIFLLVLSPIAVVGSVIPNLGEHSKKWWSALTSQLLFAPVYMILLFIVLSIVKAPSLSDPNTALAGLFSADTSGGMGPGPFDTVFLYIVLIGMLFGALTIAQGISKSGASFANKMGGKFVFGGAGIVGRQTIGRVGAKFADSKTVNQLASKSGIFGASARMALRGGQQAASGTFDVRATAAGSAMGAGAAASGGFVERKKKLSDEMRAAGSRARVAQAKIHIANGSKPGATPAEIDAMEIAIANSTGKEIETIVSENKKLLDSQEFANRISTQQLEALNKSDSFSEEEKGRIKNTRFADVNAITGARGATPSASSLSQIEKLSDSELEMIDPTTLTDPEFVRTLKQSQVDAIMKSNKFTTNQRAVIGKIRGDTFIASVTANPAIIKAKNTSPKQIAGLPITPTTPGTISLTTPAFLNELSPAIVKRIAPELDPAKSEALKDAILHNPLMANPTLRLWLNEPRNADVL